MKNLVKGKKGSNYKFSISEYLKVKEKDDIIYFIPLREMNDRKNSVVYIPIKKQNSGGFVDKDKIRERMDELIRLEKDNILSQSEYLISLLDKLKIEDIKIQENL